MMASTPANRSVDEEEISWIVWVKLEFKHLLTCFNTLRLALFLSSTGQWIRYDPTQSLKDINTLGVVCRVIYSCRFDN